MQFRPASMRATRPANMRAARPAGRVGARVYTFLKPRAYFDFGQRGKTPCMKLERMFLSIINLFVSTIISRCQNKPAGFIS